MGARDTTRRERISGRRLGAGVTPAGSAALPEREAAVAAGEQAINLRWAAADRREAAADRREAAGDRREAATALREQALLPREGAARARAERSARDAAQLRMVNERLVLATVAAQTRTEAAEQVTGAMAYRAQHDCLTGLPNRALLLDRLEQALAFALGHGQKVALMFLDLDHFKQINDAYGHAAGDQLLRSVSRRLQACVRLSDTVCRQGGDEFVLLLPDIQVEADAIRAARKALAAMIPPHRVSGHRIRATLSIGISLSPDHGRDAEALLRNADAAMYQAKHEGRNTFRVFSGS
jgi:diguanylate cyclase (GGDEF)-like protein